jgi:hypothetical protein
MLVGVVVGIPAVNLLRQPWQASWYFVVVGALIGSVVGGFVTRKPHDARAWLLPGLTIGGAILGSAIPYLKWNRSLEGALVGFVVAVLTLIIWSLAASCQEPQPNSPTLSSDEMMDGESPSTAGAEPKE